MRALVVAAVLLGTTATAPSAQAATDTNVRGATLTSAVQSVSGARLNRLDVGVHLTDPTGVQRSTETVAFENQRMSCPCAQLVGKDETGMDAHWRIVQLWLTSGTSSDGTWTGATRVGAEVRGRWELRAVIAGTWKTEDGGPGWPGAWKPVDGVGMGAVTRYAGSNWPVVTVSLRPPVPYRSTYRVTGRVTGSATGRGLAGVPVKVRALPLNWADYPAPTLLGTTTDANGYWSVQGDQPANHVDAIVGAEDADHAQSGAIWQWSGLGSVRGFTQHYLVGLSARTSGGWHHLTATITPGCGVQAQLQRRTASGWTAVLIRPTNCQGRVGFDTQRDGCYRVRAKQGELAAFTSRYVCLS